MFLTLPSRPGVPGLATRRGAFLVLLIALFMGTTARAGFFSAPPTESRPTSVDCSVPVTIDVLGEERFQNEYCLNELVALSASTEIPSSSQPSSAQARKAAPAFTYAWRAPAGASLNSYINQEVTASFSTSGPKTFTVTVTASGGGCFGVATVTINPQPLPDITIFFPNSLTVVPISGVEPTVTQITLPNTIRTTQGVLYEWYVVIDRINGYEIRQGDTNTTGIFQINQVGPYVLTVTGANGCKRTVRGNLVLAASGGGN